MRRKTAVFVGLLILAIAAGQTAAIPNLDPWLTAGLNTLSIMAWLVLAGLVGWVVWELVAKFVSQDPATDPAPDIEDAGQINHAVKNLAATLATLEQDTSQATLLILDANTYTDTLVRMVKGLALQAEKMRSDSGNLAAALDAIAAGNSLAIAQAAGRVSDAHIRELMLCDVTTASYWAGVGRTAAAQLGTLEQWAEGYDRFVGNLLTDLSAAKSRLAALTASKELAIVARPMLQIEANITEAQAVLQLQRRVKVGRAVGNLPTINVGLLKG